MRLSYLFCLALLLIIISPYLLSEGMFMDGLWYATIAHNLSQGLGSVWDLFFTATLNPHFYGHPPLAFFLQSWWFRVWGDAVYVEKLYSLSTFLVTAFWIIKIWKKLTVGNDRKLAWVPLCFLLLVPVISWAVVNNMLENTMMMFTTASVFFFLKSKDNNSWLYLFIGAIMIAFGLLTKGLVALFPLSFLFWEYVLERSVSLKCFLKKLIIVLLTLGGAFLVLWWYPASAHSLNLYYQEQIVKSLTIAQVVSSRFFILKKMLMELLPALLLVGLLIAVKWKTYRQTTVSKNAWLFLLVGLSGVVPVMVTLKQHGFYILPAYPFFAIGLALLVLPLVKQMMEKINQSLVWRKRLKIMTYALLLLGVVLVLNFRNTYGRDAEKIKDVKTIVAYLAKNSNDTIIGIPPSLKADWSLYAYFQRYGHITLDGKNEANNQYLLIPKHENCVGEPVAINLHIFKLCILKKENKSIREKIVNSSEK